MESGSQVVRVVICNHQADCPQFLQPDVCFGDIYANTENSMSYMTLNVYAETLTAMNMSYQSTRTIDTFPFTRAAMLAV